MSVGMKEILQTYTVTKISDAVWTCMYILISCIYTPYISGIVIYICLIYSSIFFPQLYMYILQYNKYSTLHMIWLSNFYFSLLNVFGCITYITTWSVNVSFYPAPIYVQK